MPDFPLIEPPEPLISFKQFSEQVRFYGKKGLLGFFNYVEITDVFMFVGKDSPPINVFSLIVFEEHKTPPPSAPSILNAPQRIVLHGQKDRNFGICRYFKTVEELETGLQCFEQEKLWKLSGKALATGPLTPLLPQFIPAGETATIPLNRLLKNNFWNGSYVLELFDTEKKSLQHFFTNPDALQALSRKINTYVPLTLASLSDRLGNILIQIPSNIGASENRLNSLKNIWHRDSVAPGKFLNIELCKLNVYYAALLDDDMRLFERPFPLRVPESLLESEYMFFTFPYQIKNLKKLASKDPHM